MDGEDSDFEIVDALGEIRVDEGDDDLMVVSNNGVVPSSFPPVSAENLPSLLSSMIITDPPVSHIKAIVITRLGFHKDLIFPIAWDLRMLTRVRLLHIEQRSRGAMGVLHVESHEGALMMLQAWRMVKSHLRVRHSTSARLDYSPQTLSLYQKLWGEAIKENEKAGFHRWRVTPDVKLVQVPENEQGKWNSQLQQ